MRKNSSVRDSLVTVPEELGPAYTQLPVRRLRRRKCQFNSQADIPNGVQGKFTNASKGHEDDKESSTLFKPKFDKPAAPKRTRPAYRVAIPQVFASMGFGFMVASVAAICIVPTLVIGNLYNNPDSEFELTEYQVSWYGSLSYLVQPIASIISGFTQNIFGRRRMMLTATIPLFVSWIVLHYASNVASLYVTQIIFGLSIGFMEAPSMSYLGESMMPKLRGTLSSLSEFLYIMGTIYLYVSGFYFHWKTVCIFGAVLPCITFLILFVLPESPTWFILKGRLDDAEKSLRWLRGWVTSEEVEEELTIMTKAITDNPYSGAKIIDGEYTRIKNTPSQVALLREKRVWKPVLLVCIFFLAGNAGSLIGMRPLFIDIFRKLHLPIPPELVLVMSSAMNGIGCVICVMAVHRTGKRFISIASLVLCGLSCFVLAGYVALDVALPALATILFALNFLVTGIGVLTMPWVLVSESFPLEARGLSSGICAAGAYVSYFFFSKTYIAFEHWITMPGVFLLYGGISIAGALYLYVFMPETEGKTLKEIEQAYQK